MTIPYHDFGTLATERVNLGTCYSVVQTFGNLLQNALQVQLSVTDALPPVPKADGNGADTLVFYGTGTGPTVTYVPNTGAYPVGHIKLFFNTPANTTNFSMNFTVTFFDMNRITVTSVEAPSVVGRFDVTAYDQSAFNIFIYGILGVAFPAALDAITNSVYNNVPADQ